MLEFLRSGGPVLWLVLALGAIALVVFLERSLQLHRDRIDSTDFLQGIFNALRRGNDQEALALCEETPGPVARLAGVAIRRRASVELTCRNASEQGRRIVSAPPCAEFHAACSRS